jgi:hypothetical protein
MVALKSLVKAMRFLLPFGGRAAAMVVEILPKFVHA